MTAASDWDRAFHAYGPARGGGDLLDVLRDGGEVDYVEEHPEAVWQPYSFLWSALYCGGWVTPATVLGLRHLTAAVTADDFGGTDPTLRWAAVWWIRDVTRAALDGAGHDLRLTAARRHDPIVTAWLDEHLRRERSIFDWADADADADAPGRVLLAAARVDCLDLLPDCYAALSPLLTPRQPEQMRAATAGAVAALAGHPELRRHRDDVAAYHTVEARHGSPLYRASMVLGLGELGVPTAEWLTDPAFAVRVCAALAPDCAGNEAAAEVLRQASGDPTAFEESLGGIRLHQMPSPQAAVTETLRTRSGGVNGGTT